MTVALVTGVTGQDGSYLAELLLREGTPVVGIARSAPSRRTPDLDLRLGSVSDAEFVERVVRETRPSHVYHFAGETSVGASFVNPGATFESVALGTLAVLEAARGLEPRPRVLLASSGEVFGSHASPANEQSPFDPKSPYAAAKCSATHLVKTYRESFGLFASVAYFYNHESPRRPAHFVTKKIVRTACRIARGLDERLELGDTTVVRDWGWAPEYVEAARRILALDAPEDFVIATGKSVRLADFVDCVFEALDLDPKRFVTTNPSLFRPNEVPSMRADPTRAAGRLGWRATVDAKEVARRMVEAERAEADRNG
jgi:GDPmannose 4,6-dehydratase